MRHGDFRIGLEFWNNGAQEPAKWRCTDIGTRVIVAIRLDRDDDPSWYNGPPYALAEVVFDEYDMEACDPHPDDIPAQNALTVNHCLTSNDAASTAMRET